MLKKIFSNKETRNKILFTLLILAVFRIGSAITLPGVSTLGMQLAVSASGFFGLLNMMGGGALAKMSIFALGVNPYITSSIIIQLLSNDVIPQLSELREQGIKGKQKLEKITRSFGVVLALIQAFGIVYGFDKGYGILVNPTMSTYLFITLVLTAGSQALVWLGDQITQKGVGSGISMIIFAGIVSQMPSDIYQTFATLGNDVAGIISFTAYILVTLLILIGVVTANMAERKIPIQYSRGNAGQDTVSYLPFKINSASVIPVIFASSVMSAPQIIASFFSQSAYLKLTEWLSPSKPIGLVIYLVLIFMFTFFYTDLEMNPDEIATNLNKNGAYTPGIRPGAEMKLYINKVLHRITFFGAIGLVVLAGLPYLLPMIVKSLPASISVGGTGVILIVGIATEVIKQLETEATKDKYAKYHGFRV